MIKRVIYLFAFFCLALNSNAQPWTCSTFPDEAGFQKRMKGML